MRELNSPKAGPVEVSSDVILNYLTTRQHVAPHAPIADVLDHTTGKFGCCPAAIRRGIEWLGIDGTRPIGRLRRSELVQLSRAVHRFWMQNLANLPTGQAQPTI